MQPENSLKIIHTMSSTDAAINVVKSIFTSKKATSYFPILIVLTESGEERVINKPDEIPIAKTFKVLKINYS